MPSDRDPYDGLRSSDRFLNDMLKCATHQHDRPGNCPSSSPGRRIPRRPATGPRVCLASRHNKSRRDSTPPQTTIDLHMKIIFGEGELDESPTTEDSSVVQMARATGHSHDPALQPELTIKQPQLPLPRLLLSGFALSLSDHSACQCLDISDRSRTIETRE